VSTALFLSIIWIKDRDLIRNPPLLQLGCGLEVLFPLPCTPRPDPVTPLSSPRKGKCSISRVLLSTVPFLEEEGRYKTLEPMCRPRRFFLVIGQLTLAGWSLHLSSSCKEDESTRTDPPPIPAPLDEILLFRPPPSSLSRLQVFFFLFPHSPFCPYREAQSLSSSGFGSCCCL